MKFTGERVIPGEGDVDLLNEHMARYRFAQRFSSGETVLDAACGSGYGSALLGDNAEAVFGVDISREAVDYAHGHYGSKKVRFCQSDCLALPFASQRFGVVVAFEIIEHLKDPEAFLKELLRVLTPAGLLILSTPNRLYYTEERGEINPFHQREFSFPEFEEILQPLFPHRAILFENHIPGLLLSGPGAKPDFTSSSVGVILQEEAAKAGGERAEETAHYFVALCSRRPLDLVSPLLYLPSTGNVLRERETHIRLLSGYLAQANLEAEQTRALLEERTRWAMDLDRQLSEKAAYILQLQAEAEQTRALLEERTRWAMDLDRQLSEKAAYILQLQADYDKKVQWALSLQQDLERERLVFERLQDEFEERTAWALRLDGELKERSSDLQVLYSSLWYRIGKNLRLSPIPPSDQPRPDSSPASSKDPGGG